MSAHQDSRTLVEAAGGTEVRPARQVAIVVAALDLGVLGDALLRAQAPPAAGFALWVAAVAGTVVILARRWQALSGEAAVLAGAAVLFAGGLVWRDSPPLKLLDAAWAAALLALLAYRRGRAWLRGAGVLQYGWALVAAGFSAAFGALALAADVDWRRELGPGVHESDGANAAFGAMGHAGRRRVLAVLRGLALSLPILAVFGALLAGADAVFARLVTDTFRLDLDRLVSHVALTGFLTWLTAGYLRELRAGPLTGTALRGVTRRTPRLRLGIVEVALPFALLDLLFALFVVVQVRYLFGGADVVQATAGLTYAEYARRGFFELVWVAALVLPLQLAAEAVLERRGPGDEWLFRGLAGTQVALVFAIMASALQRMRLYQAAFGLTELRLYATAFMAWLAVALLWLGVTVLAGRRRRFALGGLVTGAATVLGLNVLNPDVFILGANHARALSGSTFDYDYAARLSGDAVPALAAILTAAPPAERSAACRSERRLADRWLSPERADWRGWSIGSANARAAVRRLRRENPPGACPPVAGAPAVAGG